MTNRSTIRYWRAITRPVLVLLSLILLGQPPAALAGGRWGANYFPNIPLVNEDGETLLFYDDVIKGKVVAINFIYTGCHDSCPLETAKLRQVYQILGDHVGRDVFMYSISIDPENDSPAVLKEYKDKFEIGPGWQLLTGNKADINRLRTKLGMFRDEGPGQVEDLTEHNVSLIVGNESTGQWIKRTPFDTPQILASVLRDQLHNYASAPSPNRKSYAEAKRLASLDRGNDLFRSRCTACHTIGGGDSLGPDLLGVVERRDHDWLTRWLRFPDRMLQENDPLAIELYQKFKGLPMPNLKLDDVDVKALMEFLHSQSKRITLAEGG